MIGQWWTVVPTMVGMLVVLTLPTVFWVRARVRSSVVALAVAPGMTMAILTALSIVFDVAGVDWERAKVFPVLGLVGALGAVVWLFESARRAGGGTLQPGGIVAAIGPRRPLGEAQSRVRASTWAMIGVGALLAALPMLLRADPRLPAQQWDSTFHLNGVWSMLHSHSASPFGGLADLYGGRKVFYPTTWHAFTALFSTPTTVIRASNASSIVLMIVWVLGATALTSVVTRRRGAILASPILAGLLLDMPADNLTMYNQWPNAMGLAAVPGVVALAVIVGRRMRADLGSLRALASHVPLGLAVVLGALGATAAHPSSAFVLAALLLPPLLGGLWKIGRAAIDEGASARAIGAGIVGALALGTPFLLLTTSRIRAMGEYPRAGISWSYAFSHMFTPAPPFTATAALSALILVQAALLLIGVAALTGLIPPSALPRTAASSSIDEDGAARPLEGTGTDDETADAPAADLADTPDSGAPVAPAFPEPPSLGSPAPAPRRVVRPSAEWEPLWPIVSYLVFCVLTFLAYAPIGEPRTFLLAPWYLDARRIMGSHGLAMVPLMAIGFDRIAGALHALLSARAPRTAPGERPVLGAARPARWRVDAVLGLVLLLVTGVGALDSRLIATDYVYDTEALGKPGMATAGEIAMLRRMQLLIPGDAVVLGDPIAGAAYSEVIGQHTAVFPQLTMTGGDDHWQEILAKRFNEIATSPDVCEAIRALGVTYYYEDEDGWYYDFLRSSRYPGLYNVDTSTGFELVDQGGTAKLYKITACGLGE